MRAKLGVLVAAVTMTGGLAIAGGMGAVAADKQPTCERVQDQVRAATINVQSNPVLKASDMEADVRKAAALNTDVLMWQEIAPKNYKDAIGAQRIKDPGRGQWRTFHLDQSVPISVRLGGDSPWEFVSEGRQRMHDGKAEVSPHRMITWVVLADRSTGRKTVFMNTHMVSGAWNGKPNKADGWRKQMWVKHRDGQAKVIADFNARGMSVVYGGDFNRQNVQPFSTRDKQVVNTGIDHLGVVLGGQDQLGKVTERRTVEGFHSDHNAKLMAVTVSGCQSGATAKPTPKATAGPTPKATPSATRTPTKAPTTKAPTTKAPTTKAPTTPTAPTTKAPTTPSRTAEDPATPRATDPAPARVDQAPEGQPVPPVGGSEDAAPDAPAAPAATGPEAVGGLASTGS